MNIPIRAWGVIDRLFSDPNGRRTSLANVIRATNTQAKPRELYQLLRAYYDCNALYDQLAATLHSAGIWQEGLKPLRNPAFRIVEFYPAVIWPGTLPQALPIETENERIIAAIHQVWTWSNWAVQKQVAVRWLPMLGDCFVKVAQTEDRSRVYFQLIHPEHVSDFDTDERGYLTYVRIDVPQLERADEQMRSVTVTEVWSKEEQRYRVWRHQQGQDAALRQLGTPVDERSFAEFGIDFLPIVHIKFRDVGEPRGVGSYTLSLDKIDEANRQATRLAQQIFRSNKDTWVLSANGTDSSGRPLPPPRLAAEGETFTVEDQAIIALPGNSSLSSLVPNIDYDASLRILQDHMAELADDCPELTYWRLRDLGDLSGVAVRRMLSGAISRALECRGNAEAGVIRLNQMALTMGATSPLFDNLGSFEQGDFEHSFVARPVIPSDPLEDAQTDQAKAQAGVLKQQIGVSQRRLLMDDWGYTNDEVDAMLEENAERTESLGETVLRNFNRGGAA